MWVRARRYGFLYQSLGYNELLKLMVDYVESYA